MQKSKSNIKIKSKYKTKYSMYIYTFRKYGTIIMGQSWNIFMNMEQLFYVFNHFHNKNIEFVLLIFKHTTPRTH